MTEATTPTPSAQEQDHRREDEEPRVVVRDKRRIDPDSGEVRPAAAAPAAAPDGPVPADVPDDASGVSGEAAALQAALDERTSDLQRLKAEFDNYRRRVDRDRLTVAEQATAMTLAQLLPVLDDIDRARHHGEVSGGFKVVADTLEATVAKLGLTRFGAEGDRSTRRSTRPSCTPSRRTSTARPACRSCGPGGRSATGWSGRRWSPSPSRVGRRRTSST
jgi:molecular chaperone GrpE